MLAAILGVALIAWTALVFNAGGDYKLAGYKEDEAAADALIEQQAKKLVDAEANKIIDMQEAHAVGLAEGAAKAKTIYVKGQNYVASAPVFNDPKCAVPPDGVLVINSAITDLRVAAAASVLGISVPGSGTAPRRTAADGTAVPPLSGEPRAAEGVRPEVSKPDSANQVPGPGVRTRPKPTPVQ